MPLPDHLAALRDEALATSCEAWAIRHRWPLKRSGGELVGPCPACGGSDRFSINGRKNVFNCRGCAIAGEGVIALVRVIDKVDFTRACEIITGREASAPVDEAKAAELRRQAEFDAARRAADAARYKQQARRWGRDIWKAGRHPADDGPVMKYLRSRGIADPERLATTVREHPTLPWVEEVRDDAGRKAFVTLHVGPAMLLEIVMPARLRTDGDPLGRFGAVHQTWIDLDQPKGRLVLPPDDKGRARPTKKMRGIKQGGCIPLFTPQGTPRRLVMGEGIETTLTAWSHAFEPETAYWAGGDLGNMAGRAARSASGAVLHDQPDLDDLDCFIPPDWCEELVFLAEDDGEESHSVEKAWRGLRRAEALRERAREAGAALPPIAISYVVPGGGG